MWGLRLGGDTAHNERYINESEPRVVLSNNKARLFDLHPENGLTFTVISF